MAENTFLGLQPYTEADAYRFKGRTEESQELFRLIVRNDFTVCYAESGEGKTSLLNAGVFPLLRQNMYFPIAITFTSDDYQHTPNSFDIIIDRCIKDSIADYNEKNKGINIEYRLSSTDFQDIDSQSALQQELSKYSWWKLRNYKPQAMGLTFTPVFVFDQFEEVFNLPGSIVWTKKFFDWLEDVSSDSCPDEIAKKIRKIIGDKAAFPTIKEEKGFKAVFSLRKEFIGELDYWGMQTHFIPALKDNRYCLKALTYEGAKKVMTQQERFDEGKVEQILKHFVGQYSREPERTIAENLPAIPALLLSVVCDSWEKDIDTFLALDKEGIGQSLRKILEHFYNHVICSVVSDLSKCIPNLSSDLCRYDIETALFALVDSNNKRIRTKTTTANLIQVDFDAKYKTVLSDNRIIKVTKVDGEDYVEIVHDCLCPIIAKKKEVRLAAEAKKREEWLLREQAKKMRKRVSLFGLFAIVVLGLMALFLYQNRRNQIVEQYLNQTQESLVLSESEKKSIQKQKDEMALLNDSIKKLNISLTNQYDLVTRQRDSLKTSYVALRKQIEKNKIQDNEIENKTNSIHSLAIIDAMPFNRNNDFEERVMVLDYLERFRVAYDSKDQNAIKRMINDNATIVIKKKGNMENKTVVMGKKHYIDEITELFEYNEWLKCRINDVNIIGSSDNPNTYRVSYVETMEWATLHGKVTNYVDMVIDLSQSVGGGILRMIKQPSCPEETTDDIFLLNDFFIP